jgi:hypothetical protein
MTDFFVTGLLAAGFAFVTGGTLTTAWATQLVAILVFFYHHFHPHKNPIGTCVSHPHGNFGLGLYLWPWLMPFWQLIK